MIDQVAEDLLFTKMNLGKHLTKPYGLWLDLRTTDDNSLYASGRAVLNASEGIKIQITKQQATDETLNIYLYIILDTQINFEEGRSI